MSVPNINQGPAGVAALARAEAVAAPTARSRVESQASSVGFTRVAWFDVNGDGTIDPRSATAGGDATLLVPAHDVDLPTYARAAHPSATAQPASTTAASSTAPTAGNAAQTSRAVDTYQRYGQPPAPAPTPAPAPAPAPTPDTLAAVAPVLPAPGSVA